MPLLGFGAVTVIMVALITKAYKSDLAVVIAKIWAVYALYAFGVRIHHAEAVVALISGWLAVLARTVGTVL
ncbi:hypothetical protein LPA44_04140 [Halobacterium sp. KA-4]|uniref:hypothetical protein n=1 Tax=Halobacterium sp. KA-4 TaxID=2896367 RepID=UPI001E3191D1|nr:hypothetical protein [Halobacterium sp. KA-4]MCD2199089.1 hypothetical protein [Halobacterium sp. KA-4]